MAKYEPRRPSGKRPLAVLGISDVVVLEGEPAVPVTVHRVSAWGRWVREVAIPDVAAARIRELAEHFDLVWASEWGHNAHTAFRRALELPEEPWPFLPVQFDKLAAIRAYADGMPWVWIDGEVVDLRDPYPATGDPYPEAGDGHPEAGDGRRDTGDAAADGLIVRVDPHRGIAGVEVPALVTAIARSGAARTTTQQQGAPA